MSVTLRRWLFFPAVLVMAALLVWGLAGVPPFGQEHSVYADKLNHVTVAERHVTNVVAAVTFDYRGFDTLGEEFILFTSVIGATVLLRQLNDEEKATTPDEAANRQVPPNSDAVRSLTLGLIGPLAVFALYLIAHGHTSPGGGFQGGAVLATALLLVYLAGNVDLFQGATSHALMEGLETLGLGAFVLLGLAGLVIGAGFLENVLPLGQAKAVTSGGHIPLLNVATGLAVGAGLVLLFKSFLEQTLELRRDGEA
ncbi:MnhB domain-containing protein [Deinococcus sonorensis]|uniref:MnhB domain-containing protein n=2 Tax=Deinococcus sonorensis TaxID=309891 RepID=A0AAU7U4W4_9DEIO